MLYKRFVYALIYALIYRYTCAQSWKNKIVTKMWKLEKWWSLSKFLTITITSFNFFNCPVKLWRNLKMKFRSEFNLGFTNHGYLHNGAWKAWNNVKIKRAQKTRHKMFKIASSFRSSKCLKTTVELTITINKKAL